MRNAQVLIACFALFVIAKPVPSQEVRLQSKDIPKDLMSSIEVVLARDFQRNCVGIADTFDHYIYAPDSVLDRQERIYQLADFGWYVSRDALTAADKRNSKEFRGTLVTTASAYRTYDDGGWTQWFDMTEYSKFNIKKDKGGSWILEPFPKDVLFIKLSCDEIKTLLAQPAKGAAS